MVTVFFARASQVCTLHPYEGQTMTAAVPSKRILVVEDDVHVGLALKQFFERAGYEVTVAENGAEAIEILDPDAPPLVALVDLLMPGIIGNELLDYMRDEPAFATTPIAIISGSPQLAPEGYKVFPKPLDAAALLAFVRSLRADAVTSDPQPVA